MNRHPFGVVYSILALILIAAAVSVRADIVLFATLPDGQSVNLQRGSTFNVDIAMSTPPACGVSYLVIANMPDIFTLVGRNLDNTVFSFPVAPDDDGETQLGVLGAGAGLSPANGVDLGADLPDGVFSVSGTQHLARLTFRVNDDAPAGTYTITPTDNVIDGGWWSPGPEFTQNSFDTTQGISVTVASVPEPSTYLMVGTFLILGFVLRRHRQVFGGLRNQRPTPHLKERVIAPFGRKTIRSSIRTLIAHIWVLPLVPGRSHTGDLPFYGAVSIPNHIAHA